MKAEFWGTAARSHKHILLIDDDAVFGKALGRLLGQVGYRVTVADNVGEALSAYKEQAADLVITDMLTRDSDGPGMIEKLQKDDPALKFIAISGGREDQLNQARRLGARYTFRKPFVTEEVLEAIGEELG